jgi:hypothetical protein
MTTITPKNKNLTLSPTLSPTPKEENPLNPHSFPHQLYQNSKSSVAKNTTAIAKCKSTTKSVAANADLLYKKPGLCYNLKTLDNRLNETFDSAEVTHTFEVLRVKMEKDYVTKQF